MFCCSFPDDHPDLFQRQAKSLKILNSINRVKLHIGIIAVTCLLVDIVRAKDPLPVIIPKCLSGNTQQLCGFANGIVFFHDCILGTGAGLFMPRYFSRA